MVALIASKGGPLLTAAFAARSMSIRRAIAEAQRLSEDAGKRLAEVEKRWARLDFEITAMQSRAEDQRKNEEQTLSARTAGDIRRIMDYAHLEIERAAQRARDELKGFAADLAASLARQSIQIDKGTDEELIKRFTEALPDQESAQMTVQPSARVTTNV